MDGYVKIAAEIDTTDFDAEIKYIENQLDEIEHKLKQADMGFEVGDTAKLEAQYSKLSKQLSKLVKKQQDLGKIDLSNIQKNIDGVGSSINKTIKKVSKWALAIFGIRSAYLGIRKAMSIVSQYNEKMAADVEYIKYALATTLEPIIQKIINLVYTLLQYVNYLSQAWFGVNLFANASVKNFQKAGAAAKAMTKTLAGFDEMNVISDSSAGATAGGKTSFDLSAPEDVKIPSWLEWIKNNGTEIAGILAGIATGLTLIKFGVDPLLSLGIGLIVGGLIIAIKGILDFIKDPTWQNFLTVLEGIALVVAGVAVVLGGWVVALVALGVALIAWVVKNWEKVKEVLGTVGTWIYDHVISPVVEFFKGMWEKIRGIFEPVIEFFKNIFSTAWENVKIIFNNAVEIFKFVWNKIKEIFSPVVDFMKDIFTKAFNKIKEIFEPIVNFFGNLWEKIKNKLKGWGEKIGEVVGTAFKTAINAVLSTVEKIINTPIKAINSLIGVINKIPGIELTKLSEFNLPRLARGGIVNLPSRGIPIGGAIAGEAGAEGVIPLTNSQQMELLGEAIGRYITINANITNTMNGRVISREIQKIQNDSDFAANN